jgi:thiamine-phosphate pyrophosphorylase
VNEKPNLTLYFVTDGRADGGRSLVEITRAAIRGGATAVQLRDKSGGTREMLELGCTLLELTRAAGVPLIVNDRLDVALALGADGVHVGQDDLPAKEVRRLIGPERILGVSAGTASEARQAEADGADYVGAGDVFGTRSKPDAGPPIGLSGLAAITRAVSIPVVGIGGITEANAASVTKAGAAGVAVISAITRSPNPEDAAQRLHKTLALTLRSSL